MRNALILLPLVLAACTNAYPGHAACDAKYVEKYLGQKGDQKLADRIQRESRADRIRWIWPGMMVTQDFQANRLNIELDDQGKVTKFTCG
ncbi:I78 family peptidase inhibitor [Sphingomonas sp. ID0503]|uniref:I78 family peptidase inhibitor n=1 Tax=Sphingomonas sp. ID0503 TaxID=3399691 RepID=UPI003AFA50E5